MENSIEFASLLQIRFKTLLLISLLSTTSVVSGQDTTCWDHELGKIEFKKNSAKLTLTAKAKLDSLIVVILNKHNCVVLTTSYSADLCDKCGVLSWDRQNTITNYLKRKGISENRLGSLTQLDGNLDYVILSFTTQPSTLQSAPHPNSKGRKKHD